MLLILGCARACLTCVLHITRISINVEIMSSAMTKIKI